MHIALVTAGGAGMFCGSCLHDNSWARALREAGHEVTLIPLYTPLRVDDEDFTSTRVFYGGINVYLDQYLPGWRWLPRWLTRGLDAPRLLRWATRRGVSNNPAELGAMTVAMLKGPRGPQAAEGAELVRFLARDLRPDVVVFSNMLLCAEVERLKSVFAGPVFCTLQGDDIYIEGLREPYRGQVLDLLRPIAAALDGVIVHSRFYAEFMQSYLGIPREKFHRLPLAIDCRGHTGRPKPVGSPPTIGYFARLAPEKGFEEFVAAGVALNRRRQNFRLLAGGYLPPQHRSYVDDALKRAGPLGSRFDYAGSPDTLAEKVALLSRCDVFSVPAPYLEPKGLYVLEAWANGVPVVQPGHGHFPELLEEVGGGLCVPSGDPQVLAEAWDELLRDESRRRALAEQAWREVRTRHDLPALASASERLFAACAKRTAPASRSADGRPR
uniref:Glycosyltransferase n=1 Tax=Schlesneria paludicola TaxID=360056 RepID=A0A7C4QQS5_9PLAN